jgi:hypothetical protein
MAHSDTILHGQGQRKIRVGANYHTDQFRAVRGIHQFDFVGVQRRRQGDILEIRP